MSHILRKSKRGMKDKNRSSAIWDGSRSSR